MSDAQFRALVAVENRDGSIVQRYVDVRTVATLTAMAKPARGWVTLNRARIDGRMQITSATLTRRGRNELAAERARRAWAEDRQRRIDAALGLAPAAGGVSITTAPRPTLAARVDPFELVRTGAPASVDLPF